MNGRGNRWWDLWFIGFAEYVASASKDPSTKVGAVIIDENRRVVSVGYNGFPRGVDDKVERYDDRNKKYCMVVHAETNSILFANKSLVGCTIYTWPFMPCSRCATTIIQTGIVRVVAPICSKDLMERWGDDIALSRTMFQEAGVELLEVNP